MKVGEKESTGETIVAIVASGPTYTVYETESKRIGVQASDPRVDSAIASLAPEIARIRILANISEAFLLSAKSEVSYALSSVCSGDMDGAKRILANAEQRLIKLRRINARLQYLFGSMAFVLATVVVFAAAILSHAFLDSFVFIATIAVCGSAGGFLSVSLNLNKIEIDFEAPKITNFFAGSTRILISVVCAMFLYLLVKANIVLGLVSQSDPVYALLAISVVAGFSETLVPNLLYKIEAQQAGNTPQHNA